METVIFCKFFRQFNYFPVLIGCKMHWLCFFIREVITVKLFENLLFRNEHTFLRETLWTPLRNGDDKLCVRRYVTTT